MSKDIRTAFIGGKKKQTGEEEAGQVQKTGAKLEYLGTPLTSSSKRPSTVLSLPSPAMEEGIVGKINCMIDEKMRVWDKHLETLKCEVVKVSVEKVTKMQQSFSKEVDAKLNNFKSEIGDSFKTILGDIKGLICDLEVELTQQKHKIKALTTSLETERQKRIALEAH